MYSVPISFVTAKLKLAIKVNVWKNSCSNCSSCSKMEVNYLNI